jgi:cyclic pyranopterin phosphate synthase
MPKSRTIRRKTRAPSRRVESSGLTHLDARGQARMVEVADKPITPREAVAHARVIMQPKTLRVLRSGRAAKGDVLAVARIAGIQAAKRTPELIPLCHGIALTRSEVTFHFATRASTLEIEARVHALDRTVYDMLKAIDRGMRIELELSEKLGGKSGHWLR